MRRYFELKYDFLFFMNSFDVVLLISELALPFLLCSILVIENKGRTNNKRIPPLHIVNAQSNGRHEEVNTIRN